MEHVVAVGDMKYGSKGDTLVTHALGSCLGLVVYDPQIQIAGLLHAMLPLSKMFVDTGVPLLFRALYEQGCRKANMVVKAVGCGNPLGKNEMFKIGERNFTVLKKLLWKNNVLLASQDVGGTASRTVRFDVSRCETIVSSNGVKKVL